MEKLARFMEYFWLALAVITAVYAAYLLNERGWADAKTWLLFPAVCLAMWGYRRFMRNKIAEWAERDRQRNEGQR